MRFFTKFAAIAVLPIALAFGVVANPAEVSAASYYDPSSGASNYEDPDLYYQGIDPSLTGGELVDALSTLTSAGFVSHSYSSLPSIYQYSDASGSGMQMAYTGTVRSFSAGSMPSSTNKEHVWPASWYGTGDREEGAGSPGADAHNVWPAASDLNSKRGSCAFDELDFSSSWKCLEFGTYDYGTVNDDDSFVWSTAFNNSNGQNDDAMYPSKGNRGAIARILMYVATRYHNDSRYPVALHDQAITLKEGRIGKLSVLLKWHYLEPPSEFEIRRNNEIASRWHHNRNPFVDHPEYATLIYKYLPEPGQSSPTQAVLDVIEAYGNIEYDEPSSIEIGQPSLAMTVGQQSQIQASVLPSSAKQSVGFESSDPSVAEVDDKGMVTAVSEGEASISVYAVDNPDIRGSVSVKVSRLLSIALSGTPAKRTYYERDSFDPTGLTVTAFFSDGSSAVIPNESCRWTDPSTGAEALQAGTTSVECAYQGVSCFCSGILVLPRDSACYELVEGPLSDYSGRYLLVSEDYSKALDGSVALDKKNSDKQISVSIVDGVIEGDYSASEFTLSKQGSEYALISSYGQRFGSTSSGDFESGDFLNAVSVSNGVASIVCNDFTLRYNVMLFRYYSSSSQGDPISLYRLQEGGLGSGEDMAVSYANAFNRSGLCGEDDLTKADSSIWLGLRDMFFSLPEEAKAILSDGLADPSSTDPIPSCLAKYDRVIYLHGADWEGYPDFMGRNPDGIYAVKRGIDVDGRSELIPLLIALTPSALLLVWALARRKPTA
ncbi:MAG TPA: endonuclease [Candidatus Enteromonas pullicola]|uniref:Endonuclease n=1 Tax=Candidatus Alloenteromonas pullicola TaxID=2840784 RepID=A0A9D1LNR7_9FIRM|nr:endonuclease [Candidatus Enteromonas pullicola]